MCALLSGKASALAAARGIWMPCATSSSSKALLLSGTACPHVKLWPQLHAACTLSICAQLRASASGRTCISSKHSRAASGACCLALPLPTCPPRIRPRAAADMTCAFAAASCACGTRPARAARRCLRIASTAAFASRCRALLSSNQAATCLSDSASACSHMSLPAPATPLLLLALDAAAIVGHVAAAAAAAGSVIAAAASAAAGRSVALWRAAAPRARARSSNECSRLFNSSIAALKCNLP